MRCKTITTILLLCLFFTSCHISKKEEENKNWKEYARDIINSHINKSLNIPDSVIYYDYQKNDIDSIFNSTIKIIFNVDIDCTTCLMKFDYWNRFVKDIKNECDYEVPILAYINSSSNENVHKSVNNLWAYAWVYDKAFHFIDKNKLYDNRFQVVLLDQNNKIRLIGNPLENDVLGKLYKQTIINHLKNEK